MKVEQIMKRPVNTCTPRDTLNTAAKIMWDHDCGCVPIVEDGRLVGMLTDRDICMAAYTQGAPLTGLEVWKAMSNVVHICRPSDTLAVAERLMQTHGIRRLPIVDSDGRLVGLLSLSDIALEGVRERSGKAKRQISADEVARTLGSICEPRESTSLATAA
ncbi:MAG: CBS domain-containing protein [Deltaproteobacteria bacterium]|nr:CBS domain-containing protein [Deltaproteobacteria bacterium]MBI3388918.1 CBS domain-containing protein [Deltaproteobacteria bacterium]